jgi:predicted PhzF superfamily epimerase YddE/YHI9
MKGADIRLRYFVPDHEMGVSGHATIAASRSRCWRTD